MLCASETEKDSCQGDSGGAEDCPDKDDDDDDDENDDDDDEYNGLSAGLGHMCPNPQNGLFQCF